MSKLDDLLKRRRQLTERLAQLAREAEHVDAQIMTLIERARAALIGEEQQSPQIDRPIRDDRIERVRYTGRYTRTLSEIAAMTPPPARPVREPALQRPIMEVLRLTGQPMTQQDLLKMLQARGVSVKGKRPQNTLSAHVSYLVKKGVLARQGDKVAIKQASLPGTNENAAKAH